MLLNEKRHGAAPELVTCQDNIVAGQRGSRKTRATLVVRSVDTRTCHLPLRPDCRPRESPLGRRKGEHTESVRIGRVHSGEGDRETGGVG